MHEELKERLRQIETSYNGRAFWSIINQVKKDKIKDDEVLKLIANINQKRFREKVSFTLSVPVGNLLEIVITIAALLLAFQIESDLALYISALILTATLHPLSHYITGNLLGIRFTHYYLNGPARVEPTLKIDYFSYLKARGRNRAIMHVSGVIGTLAAPLIVALIALNKDAGNVAFNLFILFLLLIVFELLTSTKIGDLMRARREFRN
ncbi:hypothetical protein ANME2D_03477 [Candidatus Methanoperedens nitroreducens]|uniref:Uncharacterized protein n=1 Tax=Candidatus Methanoperedens nitratireducens TaxID=1392998 RepID=A0A062UYL3_9EURY|nr:hypothetical protein [Candidatus Methanoperedens nitroreducens]KCZ70287.1 hypothetical protein ANME2D_03477 [Candidatus Methanoperedens nitroreducens]MDJ1423127.1 hypothetical protein [Candidatus Methanoperedens sp.]